MSQQPRCAGWTWLATAAIAGTLVLSTAACAPAAYSSRGQSVYSATPYDRLQQRSQQLEMLAARARDGARLDQRRGGRHEVTDRMDDFTKHAHDLRQLARERGVPASKINDRIRRLMDDGNKVQKEWAKSRTRNPQTLADWDRALAALNDLNGQFMAASGLAVRPGVGVGTSGSFPDRPYGRTGGDGGRALLNDLDRRVNDALRLSKRSSLGATADLESLRDQVQRFGRHADQLSPGDAQDRLARMLSDTRAVQRRLSTENVPTQLRDDLNAMVGALVHLRDLTGEGVEATAGFGTRDRYAVMDPMQLSQELNRRAMRASELAADENLNDVSNKISEFLDKFRDFDTKAGRMDRDERRDRLDNLLRDAQAAQRDLAQRRVSGDLVDQWNGVVELVVKLRDAS